VVLNAANEVAVSQFLSNKIGFLDISRTSLKALEKFNTVHARSVDEVFEIDKEVRAYCES
jgi:1-deoxy-D-xylulose-5-phosphate reductoisomerase